MKKLILIILFFSAHAGAEIVTVDHGYFKLWIDCEARGPIRFQYTLGPDTGNFERPSKWGLDPDVPAHCQAKTVRKYRQASDRPSYDRGHLVPANHLDSSTEAMLLSNLATNIVPQEKTFNRGAWYLTEMLTDCYRDFNDQYVYGGVVYSDPSNDYFIETHGVKTPDWFWKVIINDNGVISWMFPNSDAAKKGNTENYLVSVNEIEQSVGIDFSWLPPEWRMLKHENNWPKPKGCDIR